MTDRTPVPAILSIASTVVISIAAAYGAGRAAADLGLDIEWIYTAGLLIFAIALVRLDSR